MLARVLSAAVNGIEAFPVEVEVNSGWGDTVVVIAETIPPNFNLPIAIRMLAGDDQLVSEQMDHFVMVGELALTGQVLRATGRKPQDPKSKPGLKN